ncbi:MAG: hypothetical protein WD176_10215 [Pirellulales bacterium]
MNPHLPPVDEHLALDDGSGPVVHVRPQAFAEFDFEMAGELTKLVERWLPLAAPRGPHPARLGWR